MDDAARLRALLPVQTLLHGFETITLGSGDAGRFLSGQRRRGNWADTERAAVFGSQPHALLGTARVKAGELIAARLLTPIEIGQILEQTRNR